MSDANRFVVEAWGDVAERYAQYWGPRFAPFVHDALSAFTPGPGSIAVVGCGPGDEAAALAERHPERAVVASDPAPAMVALARRRLAQRGLPNLTVRVGADVGVASAGGIFSSFVLQLLPDRAASLAAWRDALAPAGVIGALFWPRQPAEQAWGRLGAAIETATGSPRPTWEPELRAALPDLGLTLERELDLTHEIVHADPEEAWRELRDGCSLQVMLRRFGPELAAACEQVWLADHGLEQRDAGWVHHATARLWLLRRR